MNYLKKSYKERCLFALNLLTELFFYPFLMPILVIPSWIESLWNSRVLLWKPWGNFHGFYPRTSIAFFFYKNQWLNLNRYGRCGRSPVLGLGDYPLSKWFYVSLFSSVLYANAGAVVLLVGALSWVFSHLVWLTVAPWQNVLVVLFILFFSSTSYSMAFVRQNYNILGWMCLPLGFYAIATHQYVLASIIWLFVAFASITAISSLALLFLFMLIVEWNFIFLLTLVPAAVKLFFNVLPLISNGDLVIAFTNTAKWIGLISSKVRYVRTSKKMNVQTMYIFSLYVLSCFFLYMGSGEFPVYLFLIAVLSLVNHNFFRFADEQSLWIFFTSLTAFFVVSNPLNFGSIIGLIVAVNPSSQMLGIADCTNREPIATYYPFDHSALLASISKFFSSVPASTRIFFAFKDPENQYEKLFDGCSNLLEIAFFACSQRDIHLFPDWYSVAETNYPGSPSFWGRSPDLVIENMKKWNANFVVLYEDHDQKLSPVWKEYFSILAEFDWSHWEWAFDNTKFCQRSQAPKWWLLCKNSVKNNDNIQPF